MFEETFEDGTTYTRLESGDFDVLRGKRINGHGRITGYTNAIGELHPAVIHTEDGGSFTPEELELVEFDGRHGFIDYRVEV